MPLIRPRLFHSPLAQHQRQAFVCRLCCARGLSVAFNKCWAFPPVTQNPAMHRALPKIHSKYNFPQSILRTVINKRMALANRPISQIPHCTWPMFYSSPFITEMSTFCVLVDMVQVHNEICNMSHSYSHQARAVWQSNFVLAQQRSQLCSHMAEQ